MSAPATKTDHRLETLRRAVNRHDAIHGKGGQTAIAKEMGCSPTLLNQLLRGLYPGDATGWLDRAEQMYGDNLTIQCPVLGEIDGKTCRRHQIKIDKLRKNRMSGGNVQTTRLLLTCPTCGKGVGR